MVHLKTCVINYFLNVDFSVTTRCKDFNFCLPDPYTHLEGTVSQISFLSLSFYCMSKNGKHFVKFVYIIF